MHAIVDMLSCEEDQLSLPKQHRKGSAKSVTVKRVTVSSSPADVTAGNLKTASSVPLASGKYVAGSPGQPCEGGQVEGEKRQQVKPPAAAGDTYDLTVPLPGTVCPKTFAAMCDTIEVDGDNGSVWDE